MTVQKAGTSILVDNALDEPKIAQLAKRWPITRLSLTRVKLADLGVLALLPKLTELVIYGGKIADWTALAHAKALRTLFLNGVAIDKALPPAIGALGKLTDLSLLHLPKLEKLDLAGCTKLARFSLYDCKRLVDLSALHALPALREVTLVGTEPRALAKLVALPQLRRISGHFGSKRKDDAFTALAAKHGKATSAA